MLSSRLKAIVGMAPKAKTIADIGCDHGKVAVSLIKDGVAEHVICTDISGPSLSKARKLVEAKRLGHCVSLRVGDGLGVLEVGEADAAVIAGMGGELIADMLCKGRDKAPDTLVLSCHTASGLLRKWLLTNGYRIDDEALVFEKRHFYPVIRAVRGDVKSLSDIELEFGPVLLQKKPKTLKFFVRRRIDQTKQIRSRVVKAKAENKKALLEDIDAQIRKYAEVEKWL